MEVCSGIYGDDHSEIVYDCRNCPLCKALIKINTLESEITNLKDDLEEANERADNAEAELKKKDG